MQFIDNSAVHMNEFSTSAQSPTLTHCILKYPLDPGLVRLDWLLFNCIATKHGCCSGLRLLSVAYKHIPMTETDSTTQSTASEKYSLTPDRTTSCHSLN